MTARRIASGLLAAVVLGILVGYLGAWGKYQDELVHGASYRNHEYPYLALPALPGMVIAERMSPGDWQMTEGWQCRHLVAAANGFFWIGVAGIVYLLRFIFRPRPTRSSTVADN